MVACGGSKGEVGIWDTEEDKKVKKHFESSLIEGSNLFADDVEEVSDFSDAGEEAEMES